MTILDIIRKLSGESRKWTRVSLDYETNKSLASSGFLFGDVRKASKNSLKVPYYFDMIGSPLIAIPTIFKLS